jgi:hypothetical protein
MSNFKTNKSAVFPFDRQKAAESVAEFIRLAGGRINILKLVKLMYLLDRQSIKLRGIPVVGGRYVSMKDGPVTSQVLDSINHKNGEGEGRWDDLISYRTNHDISAKRQEPHDNLSPFEKNLICEIHTEHLSRDQFQLRDWCHDNCQEWKKPGLFGGSPPIMLDNLADGIQCSVDSLEESAKEADFMNKVFGMA